MIQSQKNRRFIRAAEQAKMVRAALKQAFPGFKFDSVRSQTYTGGGSINVDWTDGPTKPEVDAIVQKFRGGDFNAMEDLKTSHTSEINGEEVSFHCDYIFTERQYSAAFIATTAETLATLPGQTVCDLLNKAPGMMHETTGTEVERATRIARIISLKTPQAVDSLPSIIATH